MSEPHMYLDPYMFLSQAALSNLERAIDKNMSKGRIRNPVEIGEEAGNFAALGGSMHHKRFDRPLEAEVDPAQRLRVLRALLTAACVELPEHQPWDKYYAPVLLAMMAVGGMTCTWLAKGMETQLVDVSGCTERLLLCTLEGADVVAADALAAATHCCRLVTHYAARRKQRAGRRWRWSKEAYATWSSQLNCAYAVGQLELWFGRAEGWEGADTPQAARARHMFMVEAVTEALGQGLPTFLDDPAGKKSSSFVRRHMPSSVSMVASMLELFCAHGEPDVLHALLDGMVPLIEAAAEVCEGSQAAVRMRGALGVFDCSFEQILRGMRMAVHVALGAEPLPPPASLRACLDVCVGFRGVQSEVPAAVRSMFLSLENVLSFALQRQAQAAGVGLAPEKPAAQQAPPSAEGEGGREPEQARAAKKAQRRARQRAKKAEESSQGCGARACGPLETAHPAKVDPKPRAAACRAAAASGGGAAPAAQGPAGGQQSEQPRASGSGANKECCLPAKPLELLRAAGLQLARLKEEQQQVASGEEGQQLRDPTRGHADGDRQGSSEAAAAAQQLEPQPGSAVQSSSGAAPAGSEFSDAAARQRILNEQRRQRQKQRRERCAQRAAAAGQQAGAELMRSPLLEVQLGSLSVQGPAAGSGQASSSS